MGETTCSSVVNGEGVFDVMIDFIMLKVIKKDGGGSLARLPTIKKLYK